MELEFKTKNPKQVEAARYWIDTTTEQIVFGGGKAGGKSFLGATLILGDALIYPDTHYFIAREELNDLVKFTIPTIHEVFRNWKIKLEDYGSYNGQDKAFYFNNGSKVFLLACKEVPSDPLYERFGSMQMTRGWIEEGGEVAEAAKANLWLSIGRWNNEKYNLKKKLLITCNPKKGWIKREFIDPMNAGTLPETKKFVRSLVTDNPYISADYIKTLSEEKDVVRRQRLFEGSWDYDEDKDSLVTADALSDVFTNAVNDSTSKYLTVDVARKGGDRTVLAYWKGMRCYKIAVYQDQSLDVTEQIIKDEAAVHQIPYSNILVDSDGIGTGIQDHLRGIKGFVAGTSPVITDIEIHERLSRATKFDPSYRQYFKNLKAQVWWKMAEHINNRNIRIDAIEYREQLIEELAASLREKNPDSDQKLQLIPKDDVKQSLGRSPDLADAICMRAYFEIIPSVSTISPAAYNAQEHSIRLNQLDGLMNPTE